MIFPYINEMIKGFGVPEKSVAVWSSAAESALMLAEAFSAPLYAPLSDRIGRRPIIIVLLFLWCLFAVGFGFVESVWSAIFVRGCLGLFAGLGVLQRTMIGELCDKTNRMQGFALFTPSLTVGVTLAPLIGGFLANPIPRLLPPSYTLFSQHPYLLPAVVTGSTGVIAVITAIIFLSEVIFHSAYSDAQMMIVQTLPASLRRLRAQKDLEKTSHGGVWELLRYAPFQNVLFLYGLNNAISFTWEAVYPLFAFTRIDLGGLQLPAQKIGVILAFSAVLSIFLTVFIFPMLHRAIPENLCLRMCLAAYPVAVLLFPVVWVVTRANDGRLGVAGWSVLALQMLLRRTGDFAAIMLDAIVLDAIPRPEYLAMANSITFSVAAVGRAVGPFVVSWFFSLSATFLSPASPGRQLVWIVFALMSLPSIYLAYRIQGNAMEDGREGSEEERYELIGPRTTSLDTPGGADSWRHGES